MGSFNIVGDKGKMMTYPLIHINCIIDEDLSMISYVFNDIHNEEIFDFDILDKYENEVEFIRELYTRKYENPLELILKDKSNTDFIKECYDELKATGEYLNDRVFFTNVYELVSLFKQSDSVIPSIMYENPYELKVIQNDPLLSKIDYFRKDEALSRINAHGQLYFRYIDDAEDFRHIIGKSFYFSSSGRNMSEDMTEPVYNEIIYDLGRRRLNQINFFELYTEEMIGRTIN